MRDSAPTTELLFSQVREDPRIDLEVARQVAARRGEPARVLIVASGGCTAVSLLASADVAEIHAVDLNPAQLHLAELRWRAALELAPDALRSLLGEGRAAPRLAHYRGLRSRLSSAAREHWDAREDQVAFGVNRVGRFEELFRELSRRLAAGDFREAFAATFERSKLTEIFGEAAVAYSMDRSFADHFESVFRDAMARWEPEACYFLHQVLRDGYPEDPAQLPPYFAPEFAARARAAGADRLHLHLGPFAEQLERLGDEARFDLVQTSNISDWMPQPALDAMLDAVRRRLRPGGAVLARRLNGDHVLAEYVDRHFALDRELSAELRSSDRSFFYNEVVVGWA